MKLERHKYFLWDVDNAGFNLNRNNSVESIYNIHYSGTGLQVYIRM